MESAKDSISNNHFTFSSTNQAQYTATIPQWSIAHGSERSGSSFPIPHHQRACSQQQQPLLKHFSSPLHQAD
ncbi:MAG: hypothetical protein WDW38_010425 [Sanguina aurantia]